MKPQLWGLVTRIAANVFGKRRENIDPGHVFADANQHAVRESRRQVIERN